MESFQLLQTVAVVVVVAVSVTGVALFAATIGRMVAVLRTGQPDRSRTGSPGTRAVTTLREIVGHTRMLRRPVVGAAHWVVMVGFVALIGTLVTAYGQVGDPGFVLPVVGHWPPYEWAVEAVAWLTLLGILALVVVRQVQSRSGRWSRFYRSTAWQAYYVEATIVVIAVCVLTLRALEYAYESAEGASTATLLHYPLTAWLGEALTGLSVQALSVAIVLVATAKIVVSMAWFVVIGLTPTMGVAWHRFTAPFNVFLKRHADGRTSLGALQPIMVDGRPVDLENADELDEDAALGAGRAQDLTWKNLLDLTTCTECGRCQDQCPAWQTEKPLSPKLLITALRTRAYDDAPYLLAGQDAPERPLVGEVAGGADYVGPGSGSRTGSGDAGPGTGPTAADVHEDVLSNAFLTSAAMTDDVLWSCTTCGACVEQCPVDIEHVDTIVDMRRHQVLLESAFPSELNGLFGNLEKRQNPWGVAAKARLDWAKDLPFPVPVVGGGGTDDPEDLSGVDYLFWVGCAGAFEDRAKKTTRAVAELLHTAGVSLRRPRPRRGVHGRPGPPGRQRVPVPDAGRAERRDLSRSAHEGGGRTKVVVTCPHCFNTLGNEYPQLGTELDVVHHTQLLNRLVREKRLTPVSAPEAERRDVTYHDPCYLGRHNGVYAPPRELIEASGTRLTEMPRNSETSLLLRRRRRPDVDGGEARQRINVNRTEEAVATGAGAIAVGCPFCRVMLSDGLSSMQSEQKAPERDRGPRRRPAAAGGGQPGPDADAGVRRPGLSPPDRVGSDQLGSDQVGGGQQEALEQVGPRLDRDLQVVRGLDALDDDGDPRAQGACLRDDPGQGPGRHRLEVDLDEVRIGHQGRPVVAALPVVDGDLVAAGHQLLHAGHDVGVGVHALEHLHHDAAAGLRQGLLAHEERPRRVDEDQPRGVVDLVQQVNHGRRGELVVGLGGQLRRRPCRGVAEQQLDADLATGGVDDRLHGHRRRLVPGQHGVSMGSHRASWRTCGLRPLTASDRRRRGITAGQSVITPGSGPRGSRRRRRRPRRRARPARG